MAEPTTEKETSSVMSDSSLLSDSSAASEYFLGRIGRDESEELPSPNQCSVKVEIPGSDPRLMNMLDCQIFPLGHQYRMIGCDAKEYRGVAALPLNKEGGGHFVVLLNCTGVLMVLRSNEMRWRRFQTLSTATCDDLVIFRGRFYSLFVNGDVFGFDPYFLELTPLVRLELLNSASSTSLVPSGDDELFLVEQIIPLNGNALDFDRLTLRVCMLDVEAGQWVVVKDIGDRVFIIGDLGTVSCSAVELPDGCETSSGRAKDVVTKEKRLIVTVIGSLEVTANIDFPKQTMTSRNKCMNWTFGSCASMVEPIDNFDFEVEFTFTETLNMMRSDDRAEVLTNPSLWTLALPYQNQKDLIKSKLCNKASTSFLCGLCGRAFGSVMR
ncbi:unnamed protein product [Brassica rapa subsp. trilocularis]